MVGLSIGLLAPAWTRGAHLHDRAGEYRRIGYVDLR